MTSITPFCIFLLLIVSIVGYTESHSSERISIGHQDCEREKEYDFIIVGAGSAGSVLANRLSENCNWKILLVEIGSVEDFMAELPPLLGAILLTDFNWGYITESQANACLAMEDHRCLWPKGRALGGSSVINGLVYTRGNPEDYNRWAAMGNPGWSYADVLPYFLKSERSRLEVSDEQYHNRNGELGVENPYTTDLGFAFIAAGQELGYNVTDYNSPNQIGVSRIQATERKGRRDSTAKAFIQPVTYRDNLQIITGAMVTKVLIDRRTKTAYGIEYDWRNKTIRAKAKKEVIVSAGVINSPQLLMLSGVGPEKHLKEHGITPICDLPVGQTIYDHMGFGGLVINTNFTPGGPLTLNPSEILPYYWTGQGPVSGPGGFDAVAFVATEMSRNKDCPDVEMLLRQGSLPTDNGTFGRRSLGVRQDYYDQMYAPLQGASTFSVLPVVLHPKSKGYMKLRSSNPYQYPLFYPNYFSDSHDLRTMVAGIRVLQRFLATSALQRYDARINPKPFVGCEQLTYDSDEYWQCAVKQMASPAHHQIASCKMGPASDPTSVVDNKLRVHGISRLRVVDASVIPMPLSAHTNAPTIMVAEVASDIIKKAWK